MNRTVYIIEGPDGSLSEDFDSLDAALVVARGLDNGAVVLKAKTDSAGAISAMELAWKPA